MDTFLESVASNAVVAVLLALAAVVVARLVRRPEVVYWLWLLVFIKLLTPPIFGVPLSLRGQAATSRLAEPAAEHVVGSDATPESTTSAAAAAPARNREVAQETGEAEASTSRAAHRDAFPPRPGWEGIERPGLAAAANVALRALDRQEPRFRIGSLPWQPMLLGIALTGSLFWFGLAASRLVRFGRCVRRGRLAPEPLQGVVRQMAEQFGLQRCPDVRVIDAQVPPLLWFSGGRTMIALPGELLEHLDAKGRSFLVAHEMAHYCRGDHWVRWAEALALGLYWWHPVVWWAARRLHQAEEQCCDAWVVQNTPGDAKSYAHTLLTAVEFLSVARPRLPALASGMDEVGTLRQRIEMILASPMPRRRPWLGILIVLVLALATLPWSAHTSSRNFAEAMITMPNEDQHVATASKTSPEAKPATTALQVSGVVCSADGKPVPGAAVYLAVDDGMQTLADFVANGKLLYSALPVEQQARESEVRRVRHGQSTPQSLTDATGRFRMEIETRSLKHPAVKAVAVASGYGLASQVWKDDGQEMKIVMPKAVSIQGRLLTANGTPAAEAVIMAIQVGGYDSGVGISQDTPESDLPPYWPRPLKTDADGRFTLAGMPAGSHVVLDVTHPRCARDELTIDTDLGATETTRGFDIALLPPTFRQSLSPARPVEGVVTAADTGKPMANVLVDVIPMGRHGGRSVYTHTDTRGHYRVSDRAGSSWGVEAYPPADSGYLAVTKSFDRWPTGATTLVHDIALPRGKVIHGRLLDGQTGKPIAGASVEYHVSRNNVFTKSHLGRSDYEFRNPVLTDEDGRFQLASLSGPGFLTIETADRAYMRKPLTDTNRFERAMPMGYTPVDVPILGDLKNEVLIRLERGRSLTLNAVGPQGEKLPWVRALWQGIDACHEYVWNDGEQFADGQVQVRGLDPQQTVRVFLIQNDRKLGAIYDITPQTPAGPIEIRLQPTATIVGQAVTESGQATSDIQITLRLSLDPQIREYVAKDFMRYSFYSNFIREFKDDRPDPQGRFRLEQVVPGTCLGVFGAGGGNSIGTITVKPLSPGEVRDVGKLVMHKERE
jgi:beta-lactamase regulating signal transducer with metallopeptidase domain